MKFRYSLLLVLGLALGARAENLKSIDSYSDAVAKANARLTIPDWPQTPEAVETSAKEAIKKGNAALDAIGKLNPKTVTFQNTVVALDDLAYEANNVGNKATIIKEANTDPKMRAAAEKAVKAMNDWFVGIDYREDVYKSIKAFAETNPQLTGEDKKLLDETMRDYRRAGLALPPEKRKEVPHRKVTTRNLFKVPHGYPNGVAIAPEGVWVAEQKAQGYGKTKGPITEDAWLFDWNGKLLKTVMTNCRNCSGMAMQPGTDLATICLNTIAPADPALPGFRLVTTPTALQRQAFELLGVSHRLGVA